MALGIAKDIRFIDGARITGLPTSIANGQAVVHEQFVPGGADTQIQFNDGGVFGADAGLTYNKTTDTLSAGSLRLTTGATKILKINGSSEVAVFESNGTTPATFTANDLKAEHISAFSSNTMTTFLWTAYGAQNRMGMAATFLAGWVPSGPSYDPLDTALGRNAAGVVEFNNGTLGAIRDWTARNGTLSTQLTVPKIIWTGTVQDLAGAGSPEGVVTAPPGSVYRNTTGGASVTLYVKETLTGNTGWVAYGVGGSGAPSTATYITQTADAGLSAEQALGSLATGLLKNTTTTGVLSIAGASDLPSAIDATKIADGSVSNTEFQFINSLSSNVQTQIDGKLSTANNLSDLADVVTARTNLGLGSIDNTSDAGKPVSTAQQTALNLKANLAGPVFGSAGIGISGSTSGTTTVTTDPVAGSAVVVIPATVSARLPVMLYASNATTEGNAATQADTTGTGGNQNTASGTAGTSELIFKSNYSLPANYLTTNKVVRVTAVFQFTSSSSPPTSNLRLRFGSTNLVAVGSFTVTGNMTSRGMAITWFIQGTAAAGSSVSVEAGIEIALNSGTAILNSVATPIAAINTSIANIISVSWQWGAATAGNNIILKQLIIEGLN